MNVQINAIHFDADEKLISFVENKIAKLSNVYDRVVSGEVHLKLDKKASYDNKITEIKLRLPGADVFAKKQSTTFEQATDLAVEALRRQIKRHKEKTQIIY